MLEIQHMVWSIITSTWALRRTLQLPFFNKISKFPSCMEVSSCNADCAVDEQLPLAHFGLSEATWSLNVSLPASDVVCRCPGLAGTHGMVHKSRNTEQTVAFSRNIQQVHKTCIAQWEEAVLYLWVHIGFDICTEIVKECTCIGGAQCLILHYNPLNVPIMSTRLSNWHKTEEDMNLNVLCMS